MRPRSRAIASARTCASAMLSPSSTTSAPCACVASTFTNGVVTGMTMVAGIRSRAA